MRGFILVWWLVASAALGARDVIVMRHCARSDHDSVTAGAPGYTDFNNYTNQPWPSWPVPPMWCLKRGMDLITAQGRALTNIATGPYTVIADNVTRDIQTAHALVAGLPGSPPITVDGSIFDPVGAGICPELSKAEITAALEERFQAVAPPANYDSLLSALQNITGLGKAPPLATLPNSVHDGKFYGSAYVAHRFTEDFLLQYAGGLPAGWGKVGVDNVYELMALHVYYRHVSNRAWNITQHKYSQLLYHIMEQLDTEEGTVVYVGHDGDLDGIATLLGLQWQDTPYPSGGSPPGGMLRFHLPDNGHVTATFHYMTLEKVEPSSLHTGKAVFNSTGDNTVDLLTMVNLALRAIDVACVRVRKQPRDAQRPTL